MSKCQNVLGRKERLESPWLCYLVPVASSRQVFVHEWRYQFCKDLEISSTFSIPIEQESSKFLFEDFS